MLARATVNEREVRAGRTAAVIGRGLGLPPARRVELSGGAAPLRFTLTNEALPLPPPADLPAAEVPAGRARVVCVRDLAPGTYTLTADGAPVATASAREWGEGVRLARGPEFDQAERLRAAIVAKNRLYFYRWRPANETYLFGFRKQEQGQNAIEIPKFDPFVVDKEQEIAKLRVPTTHTYELKRGTDK